VFSQKSVSVVRHHYWHNQPVRKRLGARRVLAEVVILPRGDATPRISAFWLARREVLQDTTAALQP